jgi:hypothetical protein
VGYESDALDNDDYTEYYVEQQYKAVHEYLEKKKLAFNDEDFFSGSVADHFAGLLKSYLNAVVELFVSGRSKPAREGRMKTSHFEGRIALSAVRTAQRRDEHTQREPATFDFDLGSAWLVAPADCARTGPQPGDGRPVFATGPVKTGHFDPRLGG